MGFLPLRLERTYEEWWFVAPIDWAAANGHTEVVRELLRMDPSLLHNLTSKRRLRRLEKLWDDHCSFAQAASGRAKVVKELLLLNLDHRFPKEQGIDEASKQTLDQYHGLKQGMCIGKQNLDMGVLLHHGLQSDLDDAYWVLYVAACAGDESLLRNTMRSLSSSSHKPIPQGLDCEFGLSDLLYAAARGRNKAIFKNILSLAQSRVGYMYNECNSIVYRHRAEYTDVQTKALLAAARAGNVDVVKGLLLRDDGDDADDNDGDGDGDTNKKNQKTMNVLYFRDSNGFTALHAAAGRGHLQVVKLILELFPESICGQDSKENTALHIAARRGCLQVAMEMMNHSKEVIYMKNMNGETPLHAAVIGTKQAPTNIIMKQGGKIEMVKELLKGASSMLDYVNWKTEQGQTALHLSVATAKIDEKLVSLLLEYPGIRVSERDELGFTPLDLAKTCRETHQDAEFRCNIAIFLLHSAMLKNPILKNPHNVHISVADSGASLIKSESVGSTSNVRGREIKTRPTSSRSLASFLSIRSPEMHLDTLESPDVQAESDIIGSPLIPTQCFTLIHTLRRVGAKFRKKCHNNIENPHPEDLPLRQQFMTTSIDPQLESAVSASAVCNTRAESPSSFIKTSIFKTFSHRTDVRRKHKTKDNTMALWSVDHKRSHAFQYQNSLHHSVVNIDGDDDAMIGTNHDQIYLDRQFSTSRQSVHISNPCFCLVLFNGQSWREGRPVVDPSLEAVNSLVRIDSIGRRSEVNSMENIPQLTQSSSLTESSNGAPRQSSEPEPISNARSTSGSSHNSTPRPSASLSLSPWLSPRLRAARKLARNIDVISTGSSTSGNGPPPLVHTTSLNRNESIGGTSSCLGSACLRRG